MRRKHDWLRETYRKSLEKIPERPVAHRTLSNIAPDPLYTPEDIGVLDPEYEEKRGFPGEFPTPGGLRLHVPVQTLDHAHVRRLRHRRADERALQEAPEGGADGPQRGL